MHGAWSIQQRGTEPSMHLQNFYVYLKLYTYYSPFLNLSMHRNRILNVFSKRALPYFGLPLRSHKQRSFTRALIYFSPQTIRDNTASLAPKKSQCFFYLAPTVAIWKYANCYILKRIKNLDAVLSRYKHTEREKQNLGS